MKYKNVLTIPTVYATVWLIGDEEPTFSNMVVVEVADDVTLQLEEPDQENHEFITIPMTSIKYYRWSTQPKP